MNDTTSRRTDQGTAGAHRAHGRVCPWYLGYLLASPVRRLFEKPERLLRSLVREGMTVLEPGCGMGFFSLSLARLVGPSGRLVCVDLQQKMIDGLRRRARKAGVLDRIETVVCTTDSLGLARWTDQADLAVAIHVVHEVPDQTAFFRQMHVALRPGGMLLILEPKGHVSQSQFEATVAAAQDIGFRRAAVAPPPTHGPGIVLAKPGV